MHALWLDRLRNWLLANISAGAEVDMDGAFARFEEWLVSEPEEVDPEKAELMEVLGVGRR